jgi:hypothetical protein
MSFSLLSTLWGCLGLMSTFGLFLSRKSIFWFDLSIKSILRFFKNLKLGFDRKSFLGLWFDPLSRLGLDKERDNFGLSLILRSISIVCFKWTSTKGLSCRVGTSPGKMSKFEHRCSLGVHVHFGWPSAFVSKSMVYNKIQHYCRPRPGLPTQVTHMIWLSPGNRSRDRWYYIKWLHWIKPVSKYLQLTDFHIV